MTRSLRTLPYPKVSGSNEARVLNGLTNPDPHLLHLRIRPTVFRLCKLSVRWLHAWRLPWESLENARRHRVSPLPVGKTALMDGLLADCPRYPT
jgi:hypothetical protein